MSTNCYWFLYSLKIIKITPIQKQITYKTPIKVSDRTYSERDIFELNIETEHGFIDTELSLIENFHKSTYKEALEAYRKPDEFINWNPEIKYPIESAIFQISNQNPIESRIRINAYLDPSLESKTIQNDQTYKVKIGRNKIAADLKFLKELKHESLRLDANRSLSASEFKEYLNVLINYDYFEEPFSNIEDYNLFSKGRFALDENVENPELQKLSCIKAFVIKPSLLGLEKTLRLIKTAKNLGKRVVISSTFEGELGHLGLARIASYSDEYLGYREEHGLGTISFLSESLKHLGICVVNNSLELKF